MSARLRTVGPIRGNHQKSSDRAVLRKERREAGADGRAKAHRLWSVKRIQKVNSEIKDSVFEKPGLLGTG